MSNGRAHGGISQHEAANSLAANLDDVSERVRRAPQSISQAAAAAASAEESQRGRRMLGTPPYPGAVSLAARATPALPSGEQAHGVQVGGGGTQGLARHVAAGLLPVVREELTGGPSLVPPAPNPVGGNPPSHTVAVDSPPRKRQKVEHRTPYVSKYEKDVVTLHRLGFKPKAIAQFITKHHRVPPGELVGRQISDKIRNLRRKGQLQDEMKEGSPPSDERAVFRLLQPADPAHVDSPRASTSSEMPERPMDVLEGLGMLYTFETPEFFVLWLPKPRAGCEVRVRGYGERSVTLSWSTVPPPQPLLEGSGVQHMNMAPREFTKEVLAPRPLTVHSQNAVCMEDCEVGGDGEKAKWMCVKVPWKRSDHGEVSLDFVLS